MRHIRLHRLFALAALLPIGLCNVNGQTQSMLLPVPGSVSPTGPCTMINFSDNANSVITSLPFFTFDLSSGAPGNPHDEGQLLNTQALNYGGVYLFDEIYLGQHPMFAQTVVHDADGNLLFFIVDNNIYNRYGEAMIDV